MKKGNRKIPGAGMRILSFLPMINWIALICIGWKCSGNVSLFCGVLYGILTFRAPDIAPMLWVVTMIQYAVVYQHVKGAANRKKGPKPQNKGPAPKAPAAEPLRDTALSPEARFLKEMELYAGRGGVASPFVPFDAYRPTYARMDGKQRAWYFYWRSEVRKGNCPDTDLSYIFVHIYELLGGCGWFKAEEGYTKLITLWMAYRERFPKLDGYLPGWKNCSFRD